jgi:hypothetical protein
MDLILPFQGKNKYRGRYSQGVARLYYFRPSGGARAGEKHAQE